MKRSARRRDRLAAVVGTAAFLAVLDGDLPTRAELAEATGLTRRQAGLGLDRLVATGRAVVDGAGLVGVRGLTVVPGPHRLELGAGTRWTWCAYDLVGIGAALDLDASAATACGRCGRAIEVGIAHGKPSAEGDVVGWLPGRPRSSVIGEFCPSALLFCDPDHLAAWREARPGLRGREAGLDDLAEVGRAAWGDVRTARARGPRSAT